MPDPGTAPTGSRLPAVGPLLLTQIGYQARLLAANGRAVMIGVGLPVLLLIASSSHSHVSASAVASRAVFGLTLTAWNIYGVRTVAAREAGILKRWRATPLPRSCYFAARILATVVVSVLAGAATVAAGVVLYGPHLTVTGALGALIVFVIGAAARAAPATALTGAVSTVDAAGPILLLVDLPSPGHLGRARVDQRGALAAHPRDLPPGRAPRPRRDECAPTRPRRAAAPRPGPPRARGLPGRRARGCHRHLPLGAASTHPTPSRPRRHIGSAKPPRHRSPSSSKRVGSTRKGENVDHHRPIDLPHTSPASIVRYAKDQTGVMLSESSVVQETVGGAVGRVRVCPPPSRSQHRRPRSPSSPDRRPGLGSRPARPGLRCRRESLVHGWGSARTRSAGSRPPARSMSSPRA